MFFLYWSTSSTSIDINADFCNTGEMKHTKKKEGGDSRTDSIFFSFMFFQR